jgi:tRNA1(Val) A37 N6-methylase TrmN6
LADWIGCGLARLRPRGLLTLIHHTERLGEIFALLEGRAGELRLLPLWPRQDRPAKRVLVRARKGSAAPLRLLPGLVLHREDGGFTDLAEAVLRDGAALDWSED